jgi:endonuclease/exonuclease/phosphatase family metal-dependent hydrolase
MKLRARILCLAAVLSLVVVPLAGGTADAKPRPGKPVTVMTRNLYLGADINRPVQAALTAQAQGKTPEEILVALANATYVTRAIVDQTDFPVRAQLLAGEITDIEPDLIGLQEVALWRSGPLQLDQVGVPNATTVDYDFLQILLDDLTARGEQYTPVAIGDRADVEAPSFTGSPFDGTMGADASDVRLTIRDVVLMHVEGGLKALGTGDAIYTHNLAVDVAGVTMRFDRGYQWVDVRAGAARFRFVNTHLEAFSSDLALAQAQELLANAPATDRTTVFVCDCNSDPLNNSIKPFDHVPHNAPYNLITGAGGFTDEWLQFAPAEQGWTSGLSELVNDPTAAGFDHRIDMVFGRTTSGGPLGVDRGEVTGTDLTDRDPATGLWPSDHGGVALRLRGL